MLALGRGGATHLCACQAVADCMDVLDDADTDGLVMGDTSTAVVDSLRRGEAHRGRL
jgi:hypothetical protein